MGISPIYNWGIPWGYTPLILTHWSQLPSRDIQVFSIRRGHISNKMQPTAQALGENFFPQLDRWKETPKAPWDWYI